MILSSQLHVFHVDPKGTANKLVAVLSTELNVVYFLLLQHMRLLLLASVIFLFCTSIMQVDSLPNLITNTALFLFPLRSIVLFIFL